MNIQRLLACAVLAAAVTGVSAAQTWSAYNKISVKPLASADDGGVQFGGMYDRVYARVSTGLFESEARYMVNISASAPRITGIIGKALVRFRPIQALEFAVGRDLDQALPGSYFAVLDDYAYDANYGKDGASVTYRFSAADITLHIPVSQEYWTDGGFSLQAALAVTARLPADIELGAMARLYGSEYDAARRVSAAGFALWQPSRTTGVSLGCTYNGTSAAEDAGELERASERPLYLVTAAAEFSAGVFGASIESEAGFDAGGFAALYCGALPSVRLYAADGMTLRLKAKARYFALFDGGSLSQDLWEVYPYFSFSWGNSLFTAGVLFSVQNSALSWNIPLTWKYTIRQSHSQRTEDEG